MFTPEKRKFWLPRGLLIVAFQHQKGAYRIAVIKRFPGIAKQDEKE